MIYEIVGMKVLSLFVVLDLTLSLLVYVLSYD